MASDITLALDLHAHSMHMGIMWEERRRCRESKLSLFTNRYPLVEMGWTRPMCYTYNREVWGLETKASCCLFCPFHTNYFYRYIQDQEPACYACALRVDELVERARQAGYETALEPKDVELAGNPIRIAFCWGPMGEYIEFFWEK